MVAPGILDRDCEIVYLGRKAGRTQPLWEEGSGVVIIPILQGEGTLHGDRCHHPAKPSSHPLMANSYCLATF
jgi:hypothetical protein